MQKQKANIFCFSCIFDGKVVPLPHSKSKLMELQCPECGKWMAVSKEELLQHDSQVVCPQCLAVCRYENDKLVARDDSDAPYRHTATVVEPPKTETRFCHSCGKQLPVGIRFCPYCGADLEAPFDKPQEPVQPQPEPKKIIEPKKRPAARSQEEPSPVPLRQSGNPMEDKLRTIGHRYDGGIRLHQHGTMPSTSFKVIAYAVIALLLALLVYLIIAGASIEPAV